MFSECQYLPLEFGNLVRAVTALSCTRKVASSNLSQNVANPDEGSQWISSVVPEKFRNTALKQNNYELNELGYESRQQQNVFLFSETSSPVLETTPAIFSGNRFLLPPQKKIKRPESGVDPSPPPSAEVTNEWSNTSSAPICPNGVSRKTYHFYQCCFHPR